MLRRGIDIGEELMTIVDLSAGDERNRRQETLLAQWSLYSGIASVYADQSDIENELTIQQQKLQIATQLEDSDLEFVSLFSIARAYKQLSRYPEALEVLKKQLEIVKGDVALKTEVSMFMASIYDTVGRYPEAIATYKHALNVFKSEGNLRGEITVLNNLGVIYENLREYAQALENLNQALELNHHLRTQHQESIGIVRRLSDRNNEANRLGNMSLIYADQGDYAQAQKLKRQALEIYQDTGIQAGVANSSNDIGSIYQDQGQYPQALENLEQALKLARELGLKPLEVTILSNLGNVYSAQGQFEQAEEFYTTSLELSRELGLKSKEATALVNLGHLRGDQGHYEQALQTYQQSLAIRRDIGDVAGESTSLTNLGFTYEQLGDYAAATTAFQQALEIQQQIGVRSKEGLTLNGLALAYAGQGNYTEALDLQQKSLALHRELGDRPNEAKVLSDMGRLFADQDQPELAIVFLKASVNLTETLRGELQSLSTEDQASFTESVSDRYRRLADLLLQQDRVMEAQRVLDLLKVQDWMIICGGCAATPIPRPGRS